MRKSSRDANFAEVQTFSCLQTLQGHSTRKQLIIKQRALFVALHSISFVGISSAICYISSSRIDFTDTNLPVKLKVSTKRVPFSGFAINNLHKKNAT